MTKKLLLSILVGLSVEAQSIIQVTDSDITTDTLWTSNNEYVLNGLVFVESGETLTIEPGTVIKGKPGSGAQSSALVVARGAKIYAEGTKEAPIVFTAEVDNIDDLDPETIYFLSKILNELNLKKIRNNILNAALPTRV